MVGLHQRHQSPISGWVDGGISPFLSHIPLSNPWPSQAGSPVHMAGRLLKTSNDLKNLFWQRSLAKPEFHHPIGPSSHHYSAPRGVPLHHPTTGASSPAVFMQGGGEMGGGLSVEQLFISLCRGNLVLFMKMQTWLNNILLWEGKLHLLCGDCRGILFCRCSLENSCREILK